MKFPSFLFEAVFLWYLDTTKKKTKCHLWPKPVCYGSNRSFNMHSESKPNSAQEPLCNIFFNAFLRRETGELLGDATQQVAAGNLQWRWQATPAHRGTWERAHWGWIWTTKLRWALISIWGLVLRYHPAKHFKEAGQFAWELGKRHQWRALVGNMKSIDLFPVKIRGQADPCFCP